jgi:hypothetical protein
MLKNRDYPEIGEYVKERAVAGRRNGEGKAGLSSR